MSPVEPAEGRPHRTSTIGSAAPAISVPTNDSGDIVDSGDVHELDASILPKISGTTEYQILGLHFQLLVDQLTCTLVQDGPEGGDQPSQRLRLDLTPPCYIMTWHRPPPHRGDPTGVSDGIPVGTIDQPKAWKYPSARSAIVFVIIGDPVPDALRKGSPDRAAQGYHCASSFQGAIVRDAHVSLTRKRERAGLYCAEFDIEEKSYWLLAHNP